MKVEKIVTELMESNCYILIDENSKEAILIDPGGAKDIIQDKKKALGIEFKYIINTHGHVDHIAGDKDYMLPVYIHEYDVSFLTDPSKNLSELLGISIVVENTVNKLKDKSVVNVGNISVEVIHTPGHTPGSICLKTDAILFTGDTLFFEGIGRTDLPGSSFEKLKNSILKRLFVMDNNIKIYPGHGITSSIGYEKNNNPFVKSW